LTAAITGVAISEMSSTSFFALPFGGETTVGNGKKSFTVPDGTYVFEISIVKAGGSDSNPAHTETLTTSQFTIDRPGTGDRNGWERNGWERGR
jgi:hypothetical protein